MKDQLLKIIKKYDSIVIFGHFSPDGDCYGSQIGLRNALRRSFPHKKVYAVGSGLPAFFERLGTMDEVSLEVIQNSLGIIVDCSNQDRCEDSRVKEAAFQIKFDHHIEGSNTFDGPKLLETNRIATAEILANWIFENKLKLDKKGAEALFLGISTDSGRFMYQLTSSHTFKIVSHLLDFGVEMYELYNILYQTHESDLALKGFVLSGYKKTEEGLIYIVMSKEDLKPLGVDTDKAAGQVNLLSNVVGYPVWATFTERDDGKYRVELRSKGKAIQPIAVKYGGGGHANACGVTALEKAKINDVINDINDFLKETK